MSSSTTSALPADAVLLHVGPHKTGTTALQGAFHTCREALAAHDVVYAGAGRQPMLAALSMTGRRGRRGDTPATQRHWQDLVDEVRANRGKRVVVSSEFFADSSPEVARDVVKGIGKDRVHVVVTLRPLGRLMPSQWQQYVQNGLRMRYADWLDNMLNKPPYDKPTPSFWNRHDQASQVKRWADAAGADRVTAIVLDESDRSMLLHTFEDLLALPRNILVAEGGVPNRSLTLGEVEVVRLLNEEFRKRNWNDDLYGRFVRVGIAKKMLAQHRPAPDEPSITTPKWAVEKAAERGAKAATTIAALGVHVIGDLATLGEVPTKGVTDEEPPLDPPLPASAAAIALVGTILASRRAIWPDVPDEEPSEPDPVDAVADQPISEVDTRTLARVLTARVRRRLGIKLRARTRG